MSVHDNLFTKKFVQKMISVAMATYNGEKYVASQIESILSQSYRNFELIIVDDCSSDDTFALLEDFAKKDARIHLYKNECNLGFKKNFQNALTHCTGDYVALCDQDDIWTKDHLADLIDSIGTADMIGANAILCDKDGKPCNQDIFSAYAIEQLPKTSDEWFLFLLHRTLFQGATCLIKKDFLQKILPVPDAVLYHDYYFSLQASLQGTLCYTQKCVLYYRRHDNNISKEVQKQSALTFLRSIATKQIDDDVKRHIYDLQSFLHFVKEPCKQSAIFDAINFYQKTMTPFKRVLYLSKNYSAIYAQKKRPFTFFLRAIKTFFAL